MEKRGKKKRRKKKREKKKREIELGAIRALDYYRDRVRLLAHVLLARLARLERKNCFLRNGR